MFRTFAAVLTATLVGALAPATAAQAAAAVPLDVAVVTANGSGCAGSTATAQEQPDGSSFTIDFDGYLAYAGDSAPPTAFRRNCQFTLQIDRPSGLTYAVAAADYSGFALLDDGVTGVQAARYYFQGQSGTTSGSHYFSGPLADSWQTTDVISADRLVFAPCDADRLLNLNTEVRVTPQPATADLNTMVLDPRITVHLTWRPCP